jgi:hypothetical protein
MYRNIREQACANVLVSYRESGMFNVGTASSFRRIQPVGTDSNDPIELGWYTRVEIKIRPYRYTQDRPFVVFLFFGGFRFDRDRRAKF